MRRNDILSGKLKQTFLSAGAGVDLNSLNNLHREVGIHIVTTTNNNSSNNNSRTIKTTATEK